MALQSVCTDGMVVDPCHAKSPVLCGMLTSPELGREALATNRRAALMLRYHQLRLICPSVVCSMSAIASKGAVLTIIVANGK